ncbi:lytic transglycosylase domain-containing protein [candidate division KSB1 bacterium]|nr:lytic transglycosylase domain-containing protein [candidate division KSB1 bacterium]NIR71610.1 lytic transglycosylase domain-containing protein [candidate division KSB1 bacterium]NIS23445.1 lytic transglycosylase domain-containing protein [candidate division KSB1 bacterium]NIT70353.1 lytic transglycosylase domain-containing protein [candidate division KSB1 bacterium]NIU24055.1 lytic transglycosylase domain-containing protein [candidate division KSB1 bacterium]
MNNKSKTSYVVGGVILISVFVTHQIFLHEQLNRYASRLENRVNHLRSYVKIDNMRNDNINRVLSVLNNFNDSLSAETKYAIASEISEASMKYENLDVNLICATITHESALTWHPRVVSPAGALGLMQVMPETGRFLAKIEGLEWNSPEEVLFDPVLNIRLGSRYLSSLIELYDVDGGLAAYNGGGKRAELWIARNRADGILYYETQNYVPAVLSLYKQFQN